MSIKFDDVRTKILDSKNIVIGNDPVPHDSQLRINQALTGAVNVE